jgi:hypothetical protein
MKTCIIKQPAGLGDILFCQKIIAKLKDQVDEIIWPINSNFMWLANKINTSAKFVDVSNDFLIKPHFATANNLWTTIGDVTILNLQGADQYFGGCMMDAKYKAVNLSFFNWSKYLHIARDIDKEKKLFEKLNINEPYILVNKKYGTPPHTAICANMDNITSNKRIIEMSILEGFDPIDWLYTIEHAHEFHTVDTSIMYIIEAVDIALHDNKLICYSRFTPANFCNVTHLFKKPWKYYGND